MMSIIRNRASTLTVFLLFAFIKTGSAYSSVSSETVTPNVSLANQQCQQLLEQGKLDQAIELADQTLPLTQTDTESTNQSAQLLMCKGTALDRLGKLSQSLQAYDQALALAKTNQDASLTVLILLRQADIFTLGNQLEQSQKILSEAWQITQTVNDSGLQESVLNSLAIVYYEMEKYDQAERYYLELLNLEGGNIAQADLATTLFNLGHVYGAKKEFLKADEVFAKSLNISKEIGSQDGVAFTLKAWGVSLFAQGRLSEGEEKLTKALTLFTKLGDQRQQASTLRNLADLELEKQQYSQAIEYYLQALPILANQGFNMALMRTYRGLATAYEKSSAFQLAYESHQNYTGLLHLHLQEKSQQITQELQVAFETERFQSENQRLASENREQQSKLLYRERMLQMQAVVIGLALIIFVLIVFMWRRSLKHAQKMEKLATTDELTLVYNRRAIVNFGEMELDRVKRSNRHFSLLLLDLDFFKKVNDTYGHSVGDEVLQVAAEVVQNVIRKIDRVGRYGGEEFMIVAPETGTEQAMYLAERVRESIERAKCASVPELEISASIGVVSYVVAPGVADSVADDSGALGLHELISQADEALYQAKDLGRNQAHLYRE